MNALPDYRIIEFLNWIKKNESSRLNIGYVRECVMRDKHTQSALENLTPYAETFIRQKNLNIEPYKLIDSIRFYLIYRCGPEKATEKIEKSLWGKSKINKFSVDESPYLMHNLVGVPTTLQLEIEFLEWLLKQKLNANDISKMPMSVFEKLAKEFSIEKSGIVDNSLLSDLLNAFKEKNPHSFFEKIKRFASMNTFGRDTEQYKSITELFCRYSDPKIVKCFFLPLTQDKAFETFINDSWCDLNALSKDYLDIYYSIPELSASGYDIKDKFDSLEIAEDALPCLVLWDNSLDDVQVVELRDLQYNEIFQLIQSIVQNVKCGNDFKKVYAEAVKKADEKRESHRPISIIEQRFNISNSEIQNTKLGTFESKLTVKDGLKK
ncbi:hypothetical protein [Ethanoligenens harbinense]|uniref:Uncharacterized protein n=1 Tax=Ethanoligenens harbinense (strain DSM 18485 / JCM 12961 / CGMCC 1.5033 / YUAN-3) TaxID=663278 RepID=E6U3T9_ETHHY|nr:hypothetical protein [Ethanoligenens harbinense]ADU26506.1 hypothetical protein Ethha_0950 [Ethanoligenens harbinense YUAN-3]AVQ95631.1 hypothetical protein CXQ68_04925 [Ethanoligenens harbinense YUAN-3]AYF38295.1 hypothetical protein CXP51_04785 [Ethanoligenens harbinense]AYF41041.1 hypothetical protein CN246_04920 [Ethanoligenens harbinense]QCN91872.1 hypothetical protein DRA42_04940 [Ethanoligenens harbinense]